MRSGLGVEDDNLKWEPEPCGGLDGLVTIALYSLWARHTDAILHDILARGAADAIMDGGRCGGSCLGQHRTRSAIVCPGCRTIGVECTVKADPT